MHAGKSDRMEHGDTDDVTDAGERLLNIDQLAGILNVSSTTARRLAVDPGFPPARRVLGCTRWLASEVVTWIRTHAPAVRPGRGRDV